MAKLEEREKRSEGDHWYEKQQIVSPEMKELKDFKIEVAFDYTGNDGAHVLVGIVVSLKKY